MHIEFTPLGILVVVAVVILLFRPYYYLIALMLFLSPFQAATAFNISIGNYPVGVQPAYFVAMVFLLRNLLSILRAQKFKYYKHAIHIYEPLLLFLLYAVISAFTIPLLARNMIWVSSPRAVETLNHQQLLQFTNTNISQSVYVVLSVLIAMAVSNAVVQNKSLNGILFKTYVMSITVVCFVGVYQVLSWYLGLYFPYNFLYTSPSYALGGIGQVLGGVKRLSSTFAEPSLVAQYLTASFIFLIESIFVSPSNRRYFIIMLSILVFVAIMLSTSTTAYLVLIIILIYYAVMGLRSRKKSKEWRYLLIIFFLLILIITPIILITKSDATIINVASKALFKKVESDSFNIRFALDLQSIKIVLLSFGFGVGWGSERSSSWLFNILANAGVWGTFLFVWFMYRFYRTYSLYVKKQNVPSIARPLYYAIVITFVAGIIGVADFPIINLWIIIGWLIGYISVSEE